MVCIFVITVAEDGRHAPFQTSENVEISAPKVLFLHSILTEQITSSLLIPFSMLSDA